MTQHLSDKFSNPKKAGTQHPYKSLRQAREIVLDCLAFHLAITPNKLKQIIKAYEGYDDPQES